MKLRHRSERRPPIASLAAFPFLQRPVQQVVQPAPLW